MNSVRDIRLLWSLTVLLHVDLQALVEAAGLALVAACDVNHAMSALLAHIVQITVNHNNGVCVSFGRLSSILVETGCFKNT